MKAKLQNCGNYSGEEGETIDLHKETLVKIQETDIPSEPWSITLLIFRNPSVRKGEYYETVLILVLLVALITGKNAAVCSSAVVKLTIKSHVLLTRLRGTLVSEYVETNVTHLV
jgi:hypothetical protein